MLKSAIKKAGVGIGFFIIFFMLSGVGLGARESQEPGGQIQIVEEVRILGLKSLEPATILDYIELKPGNEFSLEVVSSDIKRIYQSGLVEDVKVERSSVPGKPSAVVVSYIITERWMVRSVKFEGNKKTNKEELTSLVSIAEHSIFNPSKITEAEEKIRKQYEEKGMFLTRVSARVEEVKEGVVDIVFEIEEHPKPAVSKVSFYGNEQLKARELRKAMQTKQQWYLFTPSKFQEELLEEDLYRLYAYYLDHGFLEAKIQPPEAYLDPERDRVLVSVFLEEGEQYRVAQVRIQGDLVLEEEELRKGLILKEGEIYSESKLRRDLQYLSDYYSNLGYHLVEVNRDLKLDKELRLVYITFYVRKGIKIYLDRIEIKGNERTLDSVIRRELAVKEGYLYSDQAVRLSKNRLMRTGYFEEVNTLDQPGQAVDQMSLLLGVKEAKSGTLMAGGGYSSLEEFFFNLQYQQRNFLGRGWDINASFRSSSYTQNYFLQFDDPYFLDSPWHLGFTGYSYATRLYYFDREQMGGKITGGRKIPHSEYSYFYLTYSYDISNLEHFSESSQIYRLQPEDAPTSSLTMTFKRNALNNFLDPTQGSYFTSSLEYAGGPLGGENDFTKAMGQILYFQPLPIRQIGHYLSLKAQLGYMWYPDDEQILITERYFLGGSSSLRGYQPGSISPVFIEDNGTKSRIGGNKMVLFSADYIIPIGTSGFKLALFYDAGNAYNDYEEIDLSNLREDWGIGIRWLSPLGPLKFELGFPINRKEDEDSQVFNFGIGSVY